MAIPQLKQQPHCFPQKLSSAVQLKPGMFPCIVVWLLYNWHIGVKQ